jgi:hypothetical protein
MTEQNKITINETEYDFADLDEQSQYFVNQVRNLKGALIASVEKEKENVDG